MNKLLTLILLLMSFNALADGIVVDRVYHPYVTVNEREFEWRFMSSQTDDKNILNQKLGYGHAIFEKVAVEFYIIGERDQNDNFAVSGYELESRIMLTEQGQYWADWGAVIELEKANANENYEASVGLLFEKEFTKTSLTLNLFGIYEWGKTIESEWETEFRLKYRYRYMPEIQPSIELYSGEDFVGIGPGFMGVHRIEGQRQIKWEAGFITEVAHSGKNHTFRFAFEYEF
ncbi:hypothetical protein [Glaciecola sp. 1036]|uniref:hypothetical protein n=1 Tax=Alteromonadaceae TaxID=72275 RepID=UPI003D05DD51